MGMAELRILVDGPIYAELCENAAPLGLSATMYARMKLLEVLAADRAGRATAPVQSPTQDRNPLVRPECGWLRERIAALAAKTSADGAVPLSDLPVLAERLGESVKAIRGSLQSAVNSNRATFDGNVFRFITQE